MSKDKVNFVTKEEFDALNRNPDAERVPTQALQPDGGIDWDCPCLKGMASGPCGDAFKSAFSCFVFSKADPRGSDCAENFMKMQECLLAHPETYGPAADGPNAPTQTTQEPTNSNAAPPPAAPVSQ